MKNPLHLRKKSSLPKSGQSIHSSSLHTRPATGKRPIFRRRRFVFTWKKLWVTLLVLIGIFVLSATAVFAFYIRELPNPRTISQPPIQSTQILDRHGHELYTIHSDQNRTIVSGDQISKYSKEATVATEDATFYTNPGFDLRGILRALYDHLTHRGLGGGGSTITQQYVKNALLRDNSQTIDRKLKELILSIEVDQIYSKDEILTGYLNEIPYGSTAYGIEAASETYYGKHAKDLTLSEAAILAAIPQAPTYYSPYGNHLDALFNRKNYILDRMAAVGFITQAQANQAKTEAPSAANPNFKTQTDLIAPHFVFYVREKLIETLSNDPQQAELMLDQNGYKVTTSLDPNVQEMAQGVVSKLAPNIIKRNHATNAALTAVDPKTGEVLAMVGSIDYNNSKSGNTNFADAELQPGSSFKPIVYATLFSPPNTFAPSSITYDLPTDFGGGYKPLDFDRQFRGPVTNRSALAGSLNIPAVKNLYLAGIDASIATARNLGITTLNQPANHYGLSLVLGSGSVTPVEMADAYAAFANGGVHNPLRPILTIEQNGKIIKDFRTTPTTQALNPDVAYEITSILSDNNAKLPIFGSLAKNLTLTDRPVASKTGTTENFRDGWTIGYTPSISVAVWVGNNDPNQTMVNGADGAVVAAPIWHEFMQEYLKGKPVEQFSKPSDIKTLTVDKLSGKLPTDQTPDNDKVTDIFAPWQVPTQSDDVHVKVKIDKVTGKLATDLTPAADVVEQTYFNVHSWQPNNPNWENPVQAWAKANGGGTSPPTTKDDLHTDANRPTIGFSSPTDGSSVSGTIQLQANPGGTQPITQVDYYVNNVSVGSATAAPWSVSLDTTTLPPGSIVIQATVTNAIGMTATQQITVSNGNTPASSAPDAVTSPSATSGQISTNQPIKISWTNPNNSNLASVVIYESTSSDPANIGTKIQTVPATVGSAGNTTVDVSKLTPNQTYYFTLHPVNTAGLENQSLTRVSAQVLP